MFLVALLAVAVFVAPLGAFMALRAQHGILTLALAGVTVFFHALAWVWVILEVRELGILLPVSIIGLFVEAMIFTVTSAIAEELR